ncbi:hypothetical protein ACGFSD_12590 [Streptomyces caniferus]|uniref:hypothetical protein n=1 Tax=Streptomyces caniferus TaxID=285557 RepID=UPI0034114E55
MSRPFALVRDVLPYSSAGVGADDAPGEVTSPREKRAHAHDARRRRLPAVTLRP